MNASKDVLTSVLHTAQMGISGIEAVKHKAQKPELRQFLQEQQEEYSRIEAESMRLAQRFCHCRYADPGQYPGYDQWH